MLLHSMVLVKMAATEIVPTKVEDFLETKSGKSKSTDVQKAIDLDIDPGNLLGVDVCEINVKQLRKNKELFLQQTARDNMQLLVNTLNKTTYKSRKRTPRIERNQTKLPTDKSDGVSVIKLPDPTTRVPREKPPPKPRQPTKWEAYARLKGIPKKKKGRMLWDKDAQEYKPRWGYGRKDETKSWLLEVPENADPNEDQFEKKKKEKKERVAKNELQRLRNIARTTNAKVRGLGMTPTPTPSKDKLGQALAVTHKSTASLGKFTETLPKEKLKGLGKKRKFENNNADDREQQRKILKRITDGIPVLDVNRAANAAQHHEEQQRSMARKRGDEDRKKAGSKKKGGKKSFVGKTKKSFGKGKKGGGGGKGRRK